MGDEERQPVIAPYGDPRGFSLRYQKYLRDFIIGSHVGPLLQPILMERPTHTDATQTERLMQGPKDASDHGDIPVYIAKNGPSTKLLATERRLADKED